MRRLLPLALLVSAPALAQEPSLTGQTGLVSMPDARFAEEGTWRSGLSVQKPYQAIWSGVTFFPWIEGSFRYTRIEDVPFTSTRVPTADFGDYKDKTFDVKLRAFPETEYFPQIVLGMQDVQGTGIFAANYIAASKRFGEFDFTLGYGDKRIDGAFGGVRWRPRAAPNWSFVAEYDAYDYKRDHGAELSGAASYKKGPQVGIDYRWGWLGAKLSAGHEEAALMAYVTVPLEQREFVPKIDEPKPYTRINPRPTEEQWRSDRTHRRRLETALREQDFREVKVTYANGRLEALLTNTRISSMPRAIGRAARTMLSFAPLEVRELRITYLQGTLPISTYTFVDARLLQRYFNGMASRELLAPTIEIVYAEPRKLLEEADDRKEALTAFEEPLAERIVVGREGADTFAIAGGFDFGGGRFRVYPGVSAYFNDPAGAFKFDFSAYGTYDRALGESLFFHTALKATLYENVSDVQQPSNSTLPHVRTDVANYKAGDDVKLLRLMLNKYWQPASRIYVRGSAGIYEEMFGGVGGQVLYLPRGGDWAADVAIDAVRQRDFEGWFGFQDYTTLTAIASLNYKMSKGVTGTLRGGRFLAQDEGVRVELKRRFLSGFEVGAWYTVTNGKDITTPGSPDKPYYDKGIFMSMPLDTMLTKDTQTTAGFAIAPWTRDVGQMVASPGDLYSILERPVRQMHELDGLVRLGDRDDDYNLPSLGTGRDRRWPDFLEGDARGASKAAGSIDWVQASVIGGAMVLSSALLDKDVFNYTDRHKNERWLDRAEKLGDALPVGALALSAVFAFDDTRPRLQDTGTAALEASAAAALLAEGLKYGVGRARPNTGLGHREFEPGSSEDRFHSFPSRSTTVMWAAITPYAEEYNMPWLYGVAALTNVGRVAGREHWVSDTVAGSVIGYLLGHIAWQGRRNANRDKGGAELSVGMNQVNVAWRFD